MTTLPELKAFDIAASTASLWIFKKSTPTGAPPHFTGRWIETTAELDEALKQTVTSQLNMIEEPIQYDLLAANNEGSALTIDADETHVGIMTAQAAAEVPQKKVATLRQIENTKFLAIKLVQNDQVLFGISRTDNSWKTANATSVFTAIFRDAVLDLNVSPSFDIPRHVDFFTMGDTVFVKNKNIFESLLSFKQAHLDEFAALQAEQEFADIFSDMGPIIAHVGENKMQLRRAYAIKTKGFYKDAAFMQNLRDRHDEFGLTLNFDAHGRIIPTPETCKDVFTALLDHRLSSAFSTNIYDVPNTVAIAV